MPEAVAQAAAKLARLPGVRGVFWGQRSVGGEWLDEWALCVHVERKVAPEALLEAERIPAEVDGFATDVLEVGAARALSLDHTYAALDGGALARQSTITAVAQDEEGETYVLLSGHGTLPARTGRIVHSFNADGGAPYAVPLRASGGGQFACTLLTGALGDGRPVDYALARLEPGEAGDAFHHAAEGEAPFPLRGRSLQAASELRHYSVGRGGEIVARVRGVSVTPVEFDLADGTSASYTEVLVVDHAAGARFSVAGDSGSMVVDGNREVVGTVLGASLSRPVSYVLQAEALRGRLGLVFHLFFRSDS